MLDLILAFWPLAIDIQSQMPFQLLCVLLFGSVVDSARIQNHYLEGTKEQIIRRTSSLRSLIALGPILVASYDMHRYSGFILVTTTHRVEICESLQLPVFPGGHPSKY